MNNKVDDNTYEAIIILDESKIGDSINDFSNEFNLKVIGLNGKILKENFLGSKQFVRPIKKYKSGLYLQVIFYLSMRSKLLELYNSFRLDTKVIRVMFVVYNKLNNILEDNGDNINKISEKSE